MNRSPLQTDKEKKAANWNTLKSQAKEYSKQAKAAKKASRAAAVEEVAKEAAEKLAEKVAKRAAAEKAKRKAAAEEKAAAAREEAAREAVSELGENGPAVDASGVEVASKGRTDSAGESVLFFSAAHPYSDPHSQQSDDDGDDQSVNPRSQCGSPSSVDTSRVSLSDLEGGLFPGSGSDEGDLVLVEDPVTKVIVLNDDDGLNP